MRERKTWKQSQRERWLNEGREETKALSPEENIRVGTEIVQVALHNGFFKYENKFNRTRGQRLDNKITE